MRHYLTLVAGPVDAITVLRAAYLLSAAAIVVIYSVSALRNRFLRYGPRAVPLRKREGKQEKETRHKGLLDQLAAVKVPHNWFKHFYMVSVVSSMLWLQQIYTRGSVLQSILSAISTDRPSMSFNQMVLCWTLLAAHGTRRFYESITLTKPSVSEMWIGHYILGLLYYLAMGVAIWIEGAPALRSTEEPLGDATLSAPSISTFVFLPLFFLASGVQHDTHCYLNSLRKYELPSHPAFQGIIAPHYTAECAIYLSLAFLAAPNGHVVNWTLWAALTFVGIELGVSAEISKEWYRQKFGADRVDHRWRMIPAMW